jgi:hypothetical protein
LREARWGRRELGLELEVGGERLELGRIHGDWGSLRSSNGGRSATGRHGRADRSERQTPRLPEAAGCREAKGLRGSER